MRKILKPLMVERPVFNAEYVRRRYEADQEQKIKDGTMTATAAIVKAIDMFNAKPLGSIVVRVYDKPGTFDIDSFMSHFNRLGLIVAYDFEFDWINLTVALPEVYHERK